MGISSSNGEHFIVFLKKKKTWRAVMDLSNSLSNLSNDSLKDCTSRKCRPNDNLLDYLNSSDECTSYRDFADTPGTCCNSARLLHIFKTAALNKLGAAV